MPHVCVCVCLRMCVSMEVCIYISHPSTEQRPGKRFVPSRHPVVLPLCLLVAPRLRSAFECFDVLMLHPPVRVVFRDLAIARDVSVPYVSNPIEQRQQ